MEAETEVILASAGVGIISAVVQLVDRALSGDASAARELRRVESVLRESPTQRAWARALEIAASKGASSEPPPGNPYDEGAP